MLATLNLHYFCVYIDPCKQKSPAATTSQSQTNNDAVPKASGVTTTASTQLYERRYEEGYNLFDEGYYEWLKQNHPLYAGEWHKKAVKLQQQPSTTIVATTVPNTASTSRATQSQTSESTKATNTRPATNTNYISKYLVQYIAEPVQRTGKRITGARVLTSDECYKMLEEKEELKRKEQQEKEEKN